VCVFTLTGTIAIEAVGRGIPVGFFGLPWWEGMPGAVRIDDGTSFGDISRVVLPSRNDLLTFLRDLVGTEMVAGIASEDPSDYQLRQGEHSLEFWAEAQEAVFCEVDDIARGLL